MRLCGEFNPARCHLPRLSDAEDVPLAVGGLPLGPDPDLQFAHPRIRKQCARTDMPGGPQLLRRGAPTFDADVGARALFTKIRGCAN